MKKSMRICLFLFSAIFFCCIAYGGGYYLGNLRSEKQWKQEPIAEEQAALEENPKSINSITAIVPYEYILFEEEGYVAVYCADKKTLYSKTDIKINNLSEQLQKEIQIGKPIYSESELYNFLESHTS